MMLTNIIPSVGKIVLGKSKRVMTVDRSLLLIGTTYQEVTDNSYS